ncbi:MAG: TonB-dependent receptor plug domain-containing protein [Bacteroidales bacterium]|jgi:hypothetical protein|nr:TonB-dependent receptor plug domain-containing protein [Bacteroidales bacterium]
METGSVVRKRLKASSLAWFIPVWLLCCPAGLTAKERDTVYHIPEVPVFGWQKKQGSMQRLEAKYLRQLPNPSGNVEALLKTLPGVSSNNELSSQYSVRGGNFDENLLYVNHIEIHRPVLIRSGQQEGLSFINPDLVKSVDFSAGGFDARYGDKMSSVMDVQYRIPDHFAANASVSLLGASVSAEGPVNNRFSWLAGIRYKTSQYLLNTLDTRGDYDPRFFDIQGIFRYAISPKWDADFLFNITRNRYRFEPDVRSTSFGTLYESYQLNVYYDGKENDEYNSGLGALTLTFRPSGRWELNLATIAEQSAERETFDIEAAYRLNDLETYFSDSVMHPGTGSELNHARNFLNTGNYSFSHTGAFTGNRFTLSWSAAFRQETTNSLLNEWSMIDSAGYSVPYDRNSSAIALKMSRKADHHLKVRRLTSWWQYRHKIPAAYTDWTVTVGLRLNYNNLNGEWLWSPRVSATVRPKNTSRLAGHLAAGMYGQPPSYREMRDTYGHLHPAVRAQRSFHFMAGGDYEFLIGWKPFKLSSELYYKQLSRMIPYRIENVRIYYAGENIASGYVAGWDIKLNGEFVKDAESWISLSLMHSRTDIENDAYGSFPLPADQRVNFNLFFQDYFPMMPDWRVFLNLNYGSPLCYSYPDEHRFDRTFRMPAYRRVDIGLSREFLNNKPHAFFRKWTLNAEIFNLFDTKNTISYFWMQVVNNKEGVSQQYAIPNHLTSRRFNIKISASFGSSKE